MEPILIGAYLTTLIVVVVVILTVTVVWAPFILARWRRDLFVAFAALAGAIALLFSAEMRGRHSPQFYLDPALYLLSVALVGVTFFAIFHLAYEIYYRHDRSVAAVAAVILAAIIVLTILNLARWGGEGDGYAGGYPPTVYLTFESVYGLGVAAYLFFAYGSFTRAEALSDSHRADPELITGLKLAAVFALLVAMALLFVAVGVFFVDFTQPVPIGTSLFWLGWIVLVAILFLIIVRRAIGLMGRGRPSSR